MIFISILLYGLIAGLITGLGAVISISIKNITHKILSVSLGFASGIMIGISALSLIPTSLNMSNAGITIAGFVAGGLFLFMVDIFMPHIHKVEADWDGYAKMGYFIALGIALHNLPEGIAIGATSEVSYHMGLVTAVTIGLHNIAEGLCVAMPLCLSNVRKSKIVIITTMTGLSTVVGTAMGMLIGNISTIFIAFFLAFAAGAMIYITSDELIPKSHSSHSEYANVGIMLGFIIALILS
ncbi:ZIP family metal transporter [Dehalobacter sp. DCM]|uniref:ZIP family metal transporter n=1 Tax=Dehalobacter sp. DCM TaxID=2907827 RepID=UPI003081A53C|nr:ZIP family metal transporter [Dehalobacter sp. DCM]